jgi:hypothetical protein
MSGQNYNGILKEMQVALEEFSAKSEGLNAYEYEKGFREITDHFDKLLFQASVGKVPASKNGRNNIQTSYGNIAVKKNTP